MTLRCSNTNSKRSMIGVDILNHSVATSCFSPYIHLSEVLNGRLVMMVTTCTVYCTLNIIIIEAALPTIHYIQIH